ncbi:hypothetical protein C2E31_19565 [Rhodopirellula baltica]|nr:hypothetical protein C2E31_19565 [Rhodopirellula baltica]
MNKPISDEGSRFRRILVIDDNEAIHGDFDKILRSDARNESLDELDAELFGRKGNVQKLFDFDLVHATQGQEGLQLLELRSRTKSHLALRSLTCECHQAGTALKPFSDFGKPMKNCRW